MIIDFEGREWGLDPKALTLKQGVAMHLAYGFTVNGWYDALRDSDPRALQCLYWLMLQQDGQVKAIKECDCALVALAAAFADSDDEDDEGEDEAEPDPTRPTPPGAPPSPGPSTPKATTPPRPARRRTAAVASSPPT